MAPNEKDVHTILRLRTILFEMATQNATIK